MFFFGRTQDEGNRGVPVLLNVYDLLPQNDYMYPVGVGVFHSGVEVYGTEYSYGGHPYQMTGVFEVSPRQAAAFRFRETVVLGYTFKSRAEVQTIIRELSREWLGNTYNTVFKNCNHFSDALTSRLLGYGIPGWVNRLAYLGQVFQCVLPHLGLEPPTAENAQLVRASSSARGSVSAPATPASERNSSAVERRPLLRDGGSSSSSSSSGSSSATQISELSREERALIAERRKVALNGSSAQNSSTTSSSSSVPPAKKVVSVE